MVGCQEYRDFIEKPWKRNTFNQSLFPQDKPRTSRNEWELGGFLQYFFVSKSPLSPLSSPPRTEDLSLRLSLTAVLWSSQDKENDISGKALFLAHWHTKLQEIVPERLTFTENLSVTTVSHL